MDDVLQLLSQLNQINKCNEERPPHAAELSRTSVSEQLLDPDDLFMSKKLTNKLLQQIQDPLVLSSNSLPAWCEHLNQSCPFLFPFETRQLYFSATAFGASRSIVWLQSQRDITLDRRLPPGSSPRRDDQQLEFRVGRLKHDRVKVPRNDNLLEWAMQVMRVHANRKSVLEVEFLGEEGTGLGPTLEFYALVAAELQRSDLGMWLCEDEAEHNAEIDKQQRGEIDLGKGAKPAGYYVRRESGLFPAPLPQDSAMCDTVVKYFEFLGIFLAKVLQDGRIVDLPLSDGFLQLLCHNKNLPKHRGVVHGQMQQQQIHASGGGSSRSSSVAGLVQSTDDPMVSSIMSEEETDRDNDTYAARCLVAGRSPCALPESSAWYEGVLGVEHLKEIDPHRAKFLTELQDLIGRKQAIEQTVGYSEEEKRLRIEELTLVAAGPTASAGHEVLLDDLALTFTYAPGSRVYGFEATELIEDGHNVDVTVHNVEAYCDLTTSYCLQTGIARQLQAFHRGFGQVFALNKLAAFTPDEARIMICGEQKPEWSREDLMNYTEPKLGYTKDR